jgi:hypothetical protein
VADSFDADAGDDGRRKRRTFLEAQMKFLGENGCEFLF